MSKRGRYLKKLEKVYLFVVFLLEISLIISAISSYLGKNYLSLFISLIVFVTVLIPYFFRWKYSLKIPLEIEAVSVIFIYATLFLGEAQSFYDVFWWWDILLHGFSALVFGFVGFIVLYFLYSHHRIDVNPYWLGVFTFSFAVAIGVIWEIFEFSMDTLFGLNMQKSGLVDTMGDLIVDSIGALIASFLGFIYLHHKKSFFIKKFFNYLLRKD